MYAVFELAGFQFRAEVGDVIKVPKQAAEEGAKIDISNVLLIKKSDKQFIGAPYVENAIIQAEVVGQKKDDKIEIYKYKRRTKYRRTQGHRQDVTELKIKKIVSPKS